MVASAVAVNACASFAALSIRNAIIACFRFSATSSAARFSSTRTTRAGEIEVTIEPFKSLLLGLFFFSVGMQTDMRLLLSAPILLPLSVLGNGAALVWPVPGWIMAGLTAFLLGGGFAQYFHGTLHRQDNPWFVPALRRIGLLMTPAAHQLHHDTLQRDFATNCGWSNPVINALFRALRQRDADAAWRRMGRHVGAYHESVAKRALDEQSDAQPALADQ